MKKNILLFIGIFLSFVVTAQRGQGATGQDVSVTSETINENEAMNRYIATAAPGRLYTFQKTVPDVDGTPYLMENLVYGNLITADSVEIANLLYKYNIHEDRVEYNDKGKLINLFPYRIRSFSFFDPAIQKERFFRNGFQNYLDNYTALSYFEVLYDGKVKLLKKHDKPIIRVGSKIGAPGINTNTPTKFYSETTKLYLKIGDSFTLIKLNKFAIKEAFLSSKLNKHLKETKNRCRTVEDVIKAIQFYESLKK